jgi:hypothetical protein
MYGEREKDCKQHVLNHKSAIGFVLFNIIHETGTKLTFFSLLF